MDGITNAFLISNAFDRDSLSGLISINDFVIQNSMILIRMKSKPYSISAIKENGLLATNVVKYGIKEIINSKRIFCQIIFGLMRSTLL